MKSYLPFEPDHLIKPVKVLEAKNTNTRHFQNASSDVGRVSIHEYLNIVASDWLRALKVRKQSRAFIRGR